MDLSRWHWFLGGEEVPVVDDIIFVSSNDTFESIYNVPWASLLLLLPTTQEVITEGGIETVGVSWAEGDYDETVEDATYTLVGTLIDLPEGVTNTQGLVASIQVHVNFYDDSAETPTPALYQATGTLQSGTSISVPWPAHVTNDVAILYLEQTTADAAITSISGWEQVTLSPSEQAVGSTQTRLTAFIRRATSNAEADVAVASSDHIVGVIITYRGVSEHPLILSAIDQVAKSDKSTSDVACSITGLSNNQDGCTITYAVARGSDVGSARYSTEINANLSSLTERVDGGTATGNGGGLAIWTGTLASAGDSGTLTAVIASNTSEAYMVIALRGVNNFSAPSVQASNLTFHGERRVDWTKQGAGTLILYNESGTINGSFLPVDGEEYEVGDVLGGGNTVMYVGSASSTIKFERFSYNTTVAIRAFAYNLNGADPLYNTNTATLNPITPTTPVDPVFYLTQAIGVSERNVEHPEDTSRRASKAYALKYAEINGYRMLFVVMDNNDTLTVWKYDQSYILYQSTADDPSDPSAWQFYEVAGEPWPLLPTVSNIPPSVTWHSGQNWCAGVHIVSDPDEVWVYVSANEGITSPYNFGRAVVDFTGFPATPPTVVYDASEIISQGAEHSNFQGGDVIYDAGISRWIALIPNRNGIPSNNRLSAVEIWLSSDGIAFTQLEEDIFEDTPIDWGGFNLYGNMWLDSGRVHMLATEGEVPDYKARYDDPADVIYRYLQTKINEISFVVGLSGVTDLRIENTIFESDNAACSGLWPASPYITFNAETYVITSCFTWQAIESGPGQLPIDVRTITTAPPSSNLINRNAFPEGMTRLMKAHRTHLDDTYESTTISPYDEITEAVGTVVGTPTQNVLNKIDLPTNSDYITFPSSTHDQEYFAVKVIVDAEPTGGITRGAAEKVGTYAIVLHESNYLEVRLTGVGGGVKIYRSTETLTVARTARWKPKYIEVGFIARLNGGGTDIDLQLCVDCTLDLPVTMIQNDTFTEIAQTANVVKTGNVAGVTDNALTVGSQVWFEGEDNATEYNWLTHNYN